MSALMDDSLIICMSSGRRLFVLGSRDEAEDTLNSGEICYR